MFRKPIIGILGAGNLGRSVLAGLLKKGHLPENLIASASSSQTLDRLQKEFKISVTTDNKEIIKKSDIVILGVKPQTIQSVIREIAPELKAHNNLVISLAAAVRISDMLRWVGHDKLNIVRCMTGTPALIGQAAAALYASPSTTPENKLIAENLLNVVGKTAWVKEEKDLDNITPLVSSGPALVFYLIEKLIEATIKLGIDPVTAREKALQTVEGAAKMASTSQLEVSELRRQVTTPNGVTARAIKVFDEFKLQEIIYLAMDAARNRCVEFSKLFSEDNKPAAPAPVSTSSSALWKSPDINGQHVVLVKDKEEIESGRYKNVVVLVGNTDHKTAHLLDENGKQKNKTVYLKLSKAEQDALKTDKYPVFLNKTNPVIKTVMEKLTKVGLFDEQPALEQQRTIKSSL